MPANILLAAPVRQELVPTYRHDIDGLRTLAIFLVVVYHVWVGRVSGGVDVFLMISAFLLTASLTRRAQSGVGLRLPAYWVRRFQRLLPAAAVTLLLVLGATALVYPPVEWPRIWAETWASLFYVQNWELAFSAVDYYERDATLPSPLQHFWSLSMQGQVFVLWPAIIGLVALVFRHRRRLIPSALAIVFGTIFVVSLIFSIITTDETQQFAYFDTRARLWEFAAGSLLALLLPYVRASRWMRVMLGWLGLAGLILCGVVLDVRHGFPGYLALWPILSAAAIIVAGTGGARGTTARFLGSKPMTYFSRDSYALYLVHWPVLITWMVVTERTEAGVFSGLAIIALSLALARLLSAAVENPLRRARVFNTSVRRGFVVILACVVAVGGITAGWQTSELRRVEAVMESVGDSDHPGATQLGANLPIGSSDVEVIPLPTALADEWSAVGGACEGVLRPDDTLLHDSCHQSPGAEASAQLIVVIGDSHAQQLATPLIALAEEHDLGIVTVLRGGCTVGYGEESRTATGETCEPWARAAVEYAMHIQPDAVYTVVTRADATHPERLIYGVEEAVSQLRDAAVPVIGVRDNPRFSFDMYHCAIEVRHGCSVPASSVLAAENPALALEGEVTLVDFTPWLCPKDVCEGVVGNIALYIDDNHLSRTYGRTLAPFLREMLASEADIPVS